MLGPRVPLAQSRAPWEVELPRLGRGLGRGILWESAGCVGEPVRGQRKVPSSRTVVTRWESGGLVWGGSPGDDEGARLPGGRGGFPRGARGGRTEGGEPGGRHRRLTRPRVSLGPQALVAELHRRALVEYVRPLLRGRLRCRSARTRSRVAGRLREDAAQLQRLFRRLVSAARGRGAPKPR